MEHLKSQKNGENIDVRFNLTYSVFILLSSVIFAILTFSGGFDQAEKYLFLVTSYGVVVCYDAKTGSKYWIKEFGNTIYSSPVLAEGKIYLMNSKGTMYIFTADKTFSLIGEPQLGEGSFCTPAFFEGGIVIRGDKNLYCISK